MDRAVARVINLIAPERQRPRGMSSAAAEVLLAKRPSGLGEIGGSFALITREGEHVRLARSLDFPMRYFLAKEEAGPLLVVGERIDEIHACLERLGYDAQFHPSYTRMVPAHHVVTLRLIGCPDPNPQYQRFFSPAQGNLPTDLDSLGELYVGALMAEVRRWLAAQNSARRREPLGVCFSGGVDSGAVLLAVYRGLIDLGESPSRLKAFTLEVGAGGPDAAQAREFLRRLDLEMLGEGVAVSPDELDPYRAVEVIEDYKPLDVECATVGLALLTAIRRRYPEWRLLVDGDGGDENLKDYPIEDNRELTIRSVVSNSMLYQEGWGVGSIKHSLTYSGGLSRSYVRTSAPARLLGFEGWSPFTEPAVVGVAEGIPFAELTQGSHERLYSLKGEIVARGFRRLLGIEFPVFEKRRFQDGVASSPVRASLFDGTPDAYRRHFNTLYAAG